jgi:transcriptional regulator
MAKNNPQWKKAMDRKVTILFFGPHHYISPRWYEIRKSVPTWNYVSVRITGTLKVMERKDTEDFLIRLSTFLDAEWRKEGREKEAYYQKMVNEIVAFRVESRTVDAGWKLSQNHPMSDRKGVVENLEKVGDDDARIMAGMMRKMMEK